jgi:hypothetical protein
MSPKRGTPLFKHTATMGNHHTKQTRSGQAPGEEDAGTIVLAEDLTYLSFLNEENETSEGFQESTEFTLDDAGDQITVFHLFHLFSLWLLLGNDHLQSWLTNENAPALYEFADYFGIENLKAAILREQHKRQVYESKRGAIAERGRVAMLKRKQEKCQAECRRMAALVAEAECRATFAEQRAEAVTVGTRGRANVAEGMRLRLKRGLTTLKSHIAHWSREGSQQHAMAARHPVVENRSCSRNYIRYRSHDDFDEKSDEESRLTARSW